MKKIVVLLSSYNGEKYIQEQIDSILNQRLKNFELSLIIRDDGSTDKTKEIIEKNIEKDNRISLIVGENEGLVASFFDLMKISNNRFDFYSFADQDDVWKEDKLQRAIDVLKKFPQDRPQLYQSSSLPVDKNLNPIYKPYYPRRKQTIYNTIIQNISAGHTYVFNQALLDVSVNDVDTSKIYVHDSYLTNVAEIYHGLHYDRTAKTLYRQHGGNRLGENDSFIGWIMERIHRIKNGDNLLYSMQIEYIYQHFSKEIEPQAKKEIIKFLKSRKNFASRFKYIINTKLYRQTVFESFAFRILYLFGGYNLNNIN